VAAKPGPREDQVRGEVAPGHPRRPHVERGRQEVPPAGARQAGGSARRTRAGQTRWVGVDDNLTVVMFLMGS